MITISLLEKKHIPEIVKLESELLLETLGEEMLSAELHNKFAHFFVALDNDFPIGYIGGWVIDGTCDIINFVVNKYYQHKGIGQMLMKEIENVSLRENAKEIMLEVRSQNTQAINFYKLQGFMHIATRPTYYKNGDDALVLRKEIS